MTKTLMIGALVAFAAVSPAVAQTQHPVKVTAADPGALTTPDTKTNDRGNGRVSKDRLMGASADKKFTSGIYSATASKFTTEGYSVDEFMYFIKGGVTLTSADGTVTQINPGDAVFLPKGWKGTWDTPGYTKYYAIFDEKPDAN